MISVQVFRTIEALETLRTAWKELLARSTSAGNPFLTWEWVEVWRQFYFHNGRLLVVAVYDDSTLVGLAPLWVRPREFAKLFTVRSLEFLGSGITCSDHLDFIVQGKNMDAVVRAIWDQLFGNLRSEWDIFSYRSVPSTSLVLDRLVEFSDNDHRCPRRVIEEYAVCPYIRLPGSWEEYVASLSTNSRRSLKTSISLLAEVGQLELRVCSDPTTLTAEMDRFVALHQGGWQGRGKPGSFATNSFEAFHREVARRFLEADMLFLASLWLSDSHIGSFYGYHLGGKVFSYLMGVQRDTVEKASTGRVLLGRCIEEAIKRGYTEFDLLRGREPYKYYWTEADRRDMSVTFFKAGFRSLAYSCTEDLFQSGKLFAKTVLGGKSESVSRWRRQRAQRT